MRELSVKWQFANRPVTRRTEVVKARTETHAACIVFARNIMVDDPRRSGMEIISVLEGNTLAKPEH